MSTLFISNAYAAETAGTGAHTEVSGEAHGPELLGLGAEGWVYTSVTIFILIAIFGAKVHKKIAAGLDARIAEARKNLDEAAAIRAEAEVLLTDAKKQQAAGAGDAKAIVAQAEHEAEQLLADAEQEAKDLVTRRKKMAQDKIGAAERNAVAEVRAKAAAAAAVAAEALIAGQHDAAADKSMVDQAITDLSKAN